MIPIDRSIFGFIYKMENSSVSDVVLVANKV